MRKVVFLIFGQTFGWAFSRIRPSAGLSAGRPAGRPGGARVVRGEKKKNAGGPGGGSPPAKPVKGGVWGDEAPPAQIRGVWGAAPSSQNFFENFFENTKTIFQQNH